MRLPKLLAALAVTAMGFALFSANAGAVTLNAGGSASYSVHIDDNTIATDFAGIFCPPASMDTNCGHVPVTTTAAGNLTATVTFPSDQQVDLVLCSTTGTQGIPSTACPPGETEVQCVRSQVVNGATTTVTIICATTPGSFDLVIVPNFVFTCTFDPITGIPTCPGLTVSGTISLSGSGGSGSGGGTTGATTGKVTGGGKVDTGFAVFSIMAIADPARYDQGHVKYQQTTKGGCKYRAVTITRVVVVANPTTHGGSADVEGMGVANNSSSQSSYQVHVEDSGEGQSGSADAFSLKSDQCSTTNPAVANGNTQIHPPS
jgi:hypothetical protein